IFIGIGTSAAGLTTQLGADAFGWGYYANNGRVYNSNTFTDTGVGAVLNDVIGVALDLDGSKLHFSKNGVWMASSDPETGAGGFSIASGTWFPMLCLFSGGTRVTANFEGPFLYL